ncbi:amidohydrolase family protein [candidate division KSB1 bacterium]
MKKLFLTIKIILGSLIFLAACNDSGVSSQQKSTQSLAKGTFVLINGYLIDGTGSNPVSNGMIIVKDGIITFAGEYDSLSIPENAVKYDLSGSTMLPGFINAHVHRGYSKYNLKVWAREGVTTVRDLAADPREDLFGFRNEILRDLNCARLVAAGPMITVPGGYPKIPFGSPTLYYVSSPEDAYRKAMHLLKSGADILKIAIESGQGFNLEIPTLTLEEAKAVVKAAHENGTMVSAHVTASKDLETALNAGVDDIAHMVYDSLPESLINRMTENNIYWIPTLELWQATPAPFETVIDNLRRFAAAGGKAALGTDYAGYNSTFDLGMPIREIGWMQEAGMSNMQIIVSATKNAAYVCNLKNEIGTLEAGKVADILIVNRNPLKNINHLKNVRMVIHGGKIIRNDN